MGYLICEIYEKRPQICRDYPRPGDWVPESCAYYYEDGVRKGHCEPECQASCCMQPRLDGEPGGAPMPEIAGGLPCKHLLYVQKHPASKRPVPSDGEEDTEHRDDSGKDKTGAALDGELAQISPSSCVTNSHDVASLGEEIRSRRSC